MKKAPNRSGHGPSKASLKEIPEIDFSKAKVRRNPYAKRIAREGLTIQTTRGRPRKGEEAGPSVPRSIRFPESIWEQIEKRAAAEGISLHAALRAAVLEWMARHA